MRFRHSRGNIRLHAQHATAISPSLTTLGLRSRKTASSSPRTTKHLSKSLLFCWALRLRRKRSPTQFILGSCRAMCRSLFGIRGSHNTTARSPWLLDSRQELTYLFPTLSQSSLQAVLAPRFPSGSTTTFHLEVPAQMEDWVTA